MVSTRLRPAFKWVGGKSQLLDELLPRMPASYHRYFEPFAGGLALMLAVLPDDAVINDVNAQLLNVYRQLRDSAECVCDLVDQYDSSDCDKSRYYSLRDAYNGMIAAGTEDAESAALMIWLNKHCFNGLYRVNSNGLFNVPYNNRVHGRSADTANLLAIGEYLSRIQLSVLHGDFETAVASADSGDFVYFDSPYVPESVTASFVDYAKEGFSIEDHTRLADLFRRLDARGVQLMLSNNDTPVVRELYAGYHIESVPARRSVNRRGDKRSGREVIVRNY